MEKKKDCPNKLLTILMIACVSLSVIILGIVSYDKFIKKEEKPASAVVPVTPPVNKDDSKPDGGVISELSGSSSTNCAPVRIDYNGEKISKVEKITLTEKNQEFKVGSKMYKLKVDSDNNVYVNDEKVYVNGNEYYNDRVYLTDKYMFFTNSGQFSETIFYALSENGEVGINLNGCQMDDFKVVDGYLHATGGKITANSIDLDIENKDLLIKFIDNTLIVTYAK